MLWGQGVNVWLRENHPPCLQEQFCYYGADNVAWTWFEGDDCCRLSWAISYGQWAMGAPASSIRKKAPGSGRWIQMGLIWTVSLWKRAIMCDEKWAWHVLTEKDYTSKIETCQTCKKRSSANCTWDSWSCWNVWWQLKWPSGPHAWVFWSRRAIIRWLDFLGKRPDVLIYRRLLFQAFMHAGRWHSDRPCSRSRENWTLSESNLAPQAAW